MIKLNVLGPQSCVEFSGVAHRSYVRGVQMKRLLRLVGVDLLLVGALVLGACAGTHELNGRDAVRTDSAESACSTSFFQHQQLGWYVGEKASELDSFLMGCGFKVLSYNTLSAGDLGVYYGRKIEHRDDEIREEIFVTKISQSPDSKVVIISYVQVVEDRPDLLIMVEHQ